MVEADPLESAVPVCFVYGYSLYVLLIGSYLTNARSSFWRETAVYCATTIERKPDALLPSAHIPFIPQTERIEQLKTYGDAPLTVSVSIITSTFPPGSAGKSFLTDCSRYVKVVGEETVWTTVVML